MRKSYIRYITNIKKALNHEIIEISNPHESWSPVSRQSAIEDIQSKTYKYLVNYDDFIAEINVVVSNINHKYLQINKNGIAKKKS